MVGGKQPTRDSGGMMIVVVVILDLHLGTHILLRIMDSIGFAICAPL